MKETARVITTFKCVRNCSYCVNKNKEVINQAKRIRCITTLKGYEEILITGGEPTLFPVDVGNLAVQLRRQNPLVKLYLYTTRCDKKLSDILEEFDGATYTLRSDANADDLFSFFDAQRVFSNFSDCSFRLSVDPDIDFAIPIVPSVWSMVKIKVWKEKCYIPSNEDLYILE